MPTLDILILHQYFFPEIAGSALRLTELACDLKEKGYRVSVLTGLPSYTGKTPVPNREIHQGVTIERVGKTRLDKNSRLGRMINAASFFFAILFKTLLSPKSRILFIGSDPPFLALVGRWLKWLRGQKYILHIADLYPDIAVEMGYLKRQGPIAALWRWINRISFSEAELIVTLGNDMKTKIMNYLPESAGEKVRIISNWEDAERVRPIAKDQNAFLKTHGLDGKTTVLYSGNMGVAHDLDSIIHCAELLREEKNILFILIGGGSQKERLESETKERKLENVLFFPYQTLDTLSESLSAGAIHLISMKHGTEGLCIPGKFYTALASGAAIIAMVPEQTEIDQTLAEFGAGVRIPPRNPEILAQWILKLHHDSVLLDGYRRAARKCFELHFTRRRAMEEYDQLFREFFSFSPTSINA